MEEISFTEKVLREVLKGIDEGIHVVDAEGRTVFYNDFAARLDGMEEGEVLGSHLLEVFPSLTPKTSTLLKVIRTGEPIYNQQQSYTNRHGKRIVTVNSTMPVLVEGRRVGAMEVSKDITRIQELSEKVIDLEQRMRSPVEGKRSVSRGLYRFEQILTQSPVMKGEIHRARRAAATRSPVLVVGETGTGRSCWFSPSIPLPPVAKGLLSPKTALPSPLPCWKGSSSEPCGGPSPAPRTGRVCLNWRRGAPSFWTRSMPCPSICRPNCSGCWRMVPCGGWGM